MRSRVLISLAALVILALVGGGYFLLRLTGPAQGFATLDVGAEHLRFSNAYLRPNAGGGAELVVFFPDFAPAAGLADVTDKTDLADRFARIVFVSVAPADPAVDPAERTERLYQRFLSENSWSQPGGLVGRTFAEDSPYAGDELFYVAPDGREFSARCRLPDPQGKTPNICNAEFRLGDLDIGLRFAAGLLAQWRALKDGAQTMIEAAKH